MRIFDHSAFNSVYVFKSNEDFENISAKELGAPWESKGTPARVVESMFHSTKLNPGEQLHPDTGEITAEGEDPMPHTKTSSVGIYGPANDNQDPYAHPSVRTAPFGGREPNAPVSNADLFNLANRVSASQKAGKYDADFNPEGTYGKEHSIVKVSGNQVESKGRRTNPSNLHSFFSE